MVKIGKLVTDVQKLQTENSGRLDARDIAGIHKIIFELELLEGKLTQPTSIIEEPET